MDKAVQEIFLTQSQALATLALRISVLEKLLLEKKIITEAEITKEMQDLSKEFVAKTQEALRNAVEQEKV